METLVFCLPNTVLGQSPKGHSKLEYQKLLAQGFFELLLSKEVTSIELYPHLYSCGGALLADPMYNTNISPNANTVPNNERQNIMRLNHGLLSDLLLPDNLIHLGEPIETQSANISRTSQSRGRHILGFCSDNRIYGEKDERINLTLQMHPEYDIQVIASIFGLISIDNPKIDDLLKAGVFRLSDLYHDVEKQNQYTQLEGSAHQLDEIYIGQVAKNKAALNLGEKVPKYEEVIGDTLSTLSVVDRLKRMNRRYQIYKDTFDIFQTSVLK